MNKTLTAIALSAALSVPAIASANDDTTNEKTAADICLENVFNALKANLASKRLDDRIREIKVHYPNVEVKAASVGCSVGTNTHISDASREYLKPEGYVLTVSAL